MNDDSVYHQTDMNGKILTAEFIIYDFRFWYDVECYRKQAEAVHKIRNKRKKIDRYDRELETNLLRQVSKCIFIRTCNVFGFCFQNLR